MLCEATGSHPKICDASHLLFKNTQYFFISSIILNIMLLLIDLSIFPLLFPRTPQYHVVKCTFPSLSFNHELPFPIKQKFYAFLHYFSCILNLIAKFYLIKT